MTHEPLSCERRVSRRSRRSRRFAFPRLYSVAVGVAFSTIFVVVGVAIPPDAADADHVTAADCKSYVNAHPVDFDWSNNVGVGDPGYRRVCVMESEQLQELQAALIYAATGVQPEAGQFVMTPETMRTLAQNQVGGGSSVKRALAEAGVGLPKAGISGFFRTLLPDGTFGPSLRTDVKGDLEPGAPVLEFRDKYGVVQNTGVVTSVAAAATGSASFDVKVGFKTGAASGAYLTTVGAIGVQCDGGITRASTTLSTTSTNPYVLSFGLQNTDKGCRAYGAPVKQGVGLDYSRLGYAGPVLVPGQGFKQYTSPYRVTEVGSPAETTADPPQGDTVAPPHETRILYDELTASPEYNYDPPPEVEPFPAAPPDVDLAQWEQHQRRIKELTPPHGAPYGDPNYRINEDGSLTTRFSDGTELTTWPDLTELVEAANGQETWRYNDGTLRKVEPDGTETITYPDGTQVVTAPGAAPQWSRPPSPGAAAEPIPAPSAEQYPPPPSGNYSPPPPSPGSTPGCSAPAKPRFVMPYVSFGEKFPFSLIISAKEGLQQFVGTPRAPVFDLPLVGSIDMGRWSGAVGVMRNFLWFVIGVILMPIYFYTLIKGRE